ncbi:MAG: MraY family glycosyltransferase [bacterium]
MSCLILYGFSPDYHIIYGILAAILSGFVSYKSYPIIIKISKVKSLMAKPNHRTIHETATPNLGGIGIFLSLVVALTLLGSIFNYNHLLCFIGALVILFFTGLKDDLIEIKPISKLFGQVIAALAVIFITDLRVTSFYGFLGIEQISYFASVIVTVFVFIAVINAFNLIDGVDGLAAGIGITTSAILAVYFFLNYNDSMLFVSLSLIGALVSFLFFNFSKDRKIFMGDTGSLIVGFTLAYQAISFIKVSHLPDSKIAMANAPILAMAIFIFPIIDTLRVFIIRLRNGQSPFTADKNHLHHLLINLGLAHWQIALVASVFTIVTTVLVVQTSSIGIHTAFFMFIALSISFIFIVSFSLKIKSIKSDPHYFLKVNSNYKRSYGFKGIVNYMLSLFMSLLLCMSVFMI